MPSAHRLRGKWSESVAYQMLADAGIPAIPAWLVGSAHHAAKAAAEFGGSAWVKGR